MDWTRWLRMLGVLTLILVLYFAVPVSLSPERTDVARVVISALIIVALAAAIVWQLRQHLDDNSKKVDGLIVVIVLVVVVFAHIFYVLNQNDPGEFAGLKTRLDSLYFATSTLGTVGFGDVHAVGQLARGLVLVQMVFNVVFVAAAATLLSTRVRMLAEGRAELRRAKHPTD